MCAVRLVLSYAVLWGVAYLPAMIQPPVTFMGNLFFYAGVLAVLGPAEQTVVSGVLDKAQDLFATRHSGEQA